MADKAGNRKSNASKRKDGDGATFWDAVVVVTKERGKTKRNRTNNRTVRKANKEATKQGRTDMRGAVRETRALTGTNLGATIQEHDNALVSILGLAAGAYTGYGEVMEAAMKNMNGDQVAAMSAPPSVRSDGSGSAGAGDRNGMVLLGGAAAAAVLVALAASGGRR